MLRKLIKNAAHSGVFSFKAILAPIFANFEWFL